MADEGRKRSVDAGDGADDWSTGDPTDAFAVLADETRLSIVRELADERRTHWQWEGKTFAELRRAVGARDSGRFSYHLDRLVGRFVAKDGDEYKLHNNGMELVGAVEAGRYADLDGDPASAETEYGCPAPDCDRRLVARYASHFFEWTCPDHDVCERSSLPPGVLDHADVTDLVGVADDESRHWLRQARRGVCPHCRGPMTAALPATDPDLPVDSELPPEAVFVEFACGRCGMTMAFPPGTCVVDHPAVVSLYHDHGLDVRERPILTLGFTGSTHPVVESEDPVRVRVDVTVEDDDLSLWLDDEATVVEYERE